MTHLEQTLINRPYETKRVFFLFSRHVVPGYPRFDPSGINTLMGRSPRKKTKTRTRAEGAS